MSYPLKVLLVCGFGAQLTVAFSAESIEAGQREFAGLCAGCYGANGTGGERGPDIMSAWQGRRRSQEDLREFIRKGNPEAGMPAFSLSNEQLKEMAAFVYMLIAPALAAGHEGFKPLRQAPFFRLKSPVVQ